jgi:hypothetical protein
MRLSFPIESQQRKGVFRQRVYRCKRHCFSHFFARAKKRSQRNTPRDYGLKSLKKAKRFFKDF